jgi:hypothetical protein
MYGTVVVFPMENLEPGKDITEAAIALIKEWPVVPGLPEPFLSFLTV